MITGLKVSSFACKYLFYRPEYNVKWGLHKTEFWRFWNAKMKYTKGQSSKTRWKKWGHFSSYHGYFIVIRNGKIVWKVAWIEYCLWLLGLFTFILNFVKKRNIIMISNLFEFPKSIFKISKHKSRAPFLLVGTKMHILNLNTG